MNRRVLLWVVGGGIGLVLVIVLTAYFQGYLTTRVLGPKGGRVAVRQGEILSVQYKTSTTIPAVKVELCQENAKPEKCQALSAKATGAKINISIPAKFPLGKAFLKVTNRDKAGKITKNVQYRRPVLVVKGVQAAAPATQESSGGGGGGGGGSSGGGGGGGGDPIATPLFNSNLTCTTPSGPGSGNLPDLVVTALLDTITRPDILTRDGFQIHSVVKNQGTAPAGNFVSRIRLDQGNDGSWDRFAASYNNEFPMYDATGGLVAGASEEEWWTGLYLDYVDQYKMELCADAFHIPSGDNQIQESDENNNCTTCTFAVGQGPR